MFPIGCMQADILQYSYTRTRALSPVPADRGAAERVALVVNSCKKRVSLVVYVLCIDEKVRDGSSFKKFV